MTRSLERGQTLVLFILIFIFFIVPFTALAIDLPSLWMARRDRQKLVDEACLAGAIAAKRGLDVYNAITQSLTDNGVDPSFYTPNEGSGTNLGKGIEIGVNIRVAIWGPTLAWWSQLIPGVDGWEIGARAHCKRGIGAFLPLTLKEFEGPNTDILETSKPNDEWSGFCSNQSMHELETDFDLRGDPEGSEANCWVWGDWQILAGDGHRVNEGGTSMNGLVAPDVRCVDEPPGPTNECDVKYYVETVPWGAAANTLKDYTKQYIADGGYWGPLPIPGCYGIDCPDMNSALIAQQEGVSNNFLAQEIQEHYGVGDLLVVFVYRGGELLDGNKNFDYVEVIGYAVVKIVDIDANTVVVTPHDPGPGSFGGCGTISDERDFNLCADLMLYPSPEAVQDAGYDIRPILLPWD